LADSPFLNIPGLPLPFHFAYFRSGSTSEFLQDPFPLPRLFFFDRPIFPFMLRETFFFSLQTPPFFFLRPSGGQLPFPHLNPLPFGSPYSLPLLLIVCLFFPFSESIVFSWPAPLPRVRFSLLQFSFLFSVFLFRLFSCDSEGIDCPKLVRLSGWNLSPFPPLGCGFPLP